MHATHVLFSSLLCRVNNCHSCSFFSKKTEPSTAALRGFNSHRTPPPPTHTRSQCPHRCNGYNTPLPQRRRPHACILLCPFFFFSSLPLLKQRKKSPPQHAKVRKHIKRGRRSKREKRTLGNMESPRPLESSSRPALDTITLIAILLALLFLGTLSSFCIAWYCRSSAGCCHRRQHSAPNASSHPAAAASSSA